MKKIGLTWLQEKLKIKGFQLTHESYIGTTDKIEVSSVNTIIRTFKSKYDVKNDNPISHLEFALKYDDLNLAFIKEVFLSVEHQIIADYVKVNPNRKYSRIIGFLYEFTGVKSIDAHITISNYEDLLDSSKYVTGNITKISKWKINDNLLGSKEYCPIIRKTTELKDLLDWNIQGEIEKLKHEYSPGIFKRASYYLYKKESKSSSEIEKEEPSQDRMDKFIVLLEEAGQKSFEESLSEEELVRMQNIIVDPRYADNRFRDFQNYVGQTMRDYTQKVHYVCPPPQFVKSLMQGLVDLNKKNTSTATIIKATMVSFGYVYVHPFEDGNGRIHRFLIHDILVRDGIVPNSTILPVSAQILAQMEEYDATLELLSKLIGRKVKYDINDSGEMSVNNALEIEALFRYPDLTNHTVFLARAIQSTVTTDIPEELLFLKCYDELKSNIQNIVDMPDKKVDRMILFLHQNKGKLASRKRNFYKELSDNEINKMEQSYIQVFQRKNLK
ncbi:Fic family protein [Tenacibaculum ovolyticum]|uniref:Fic family protein n=1 Tax=Tenacibaculum ovolyticum TaxID=104270 RepID=UPI0009EEBED1|nr:Fic family protein [Tenacibaculum ovolyticum]